MIVQHSGERSARRYVSSSATGEQDMGSYSRTSIYNRPVQNRPDAVLQEERINKKLTATHNIILFFLRRRAILRMVKRAGLLVMAYNYDKLWKLLADRKMTKTEMCIQTGISTNMPAKMGKEEPVTMETLTKICIALNCGLDDIVEIQKAGE
ncbi:MAG: helix-turn-helix transcriptional regulator [Clostridiales bacterium]|nr:helix-turn-helix transcriptional regulator [Clostridiales bacterium]